MSKYKNFADWIQGLSVDEWLEYGDKFAKAEAIQ